MDTPKATFTSVQLRLWWLWLSPLTLAWHTSFAGQGSETPEKLIEKNLWHVYPDLIKKYQRRDFKLKGNFPKTKENAYTGNTQISVYTQDFTVDSNVFNGQLDCTIHILGYTSNTMGTHPCSIQEVTANYKQFMGTPRCQSVYPVNVLGTTTCLSMYPINDMGTHQYRLCTQLKTETLVDF